MEQVSLMAPEVDRISDLPKAVIEDILMLLPLRDAVRTSILSRNWRYEWTTRPRLVFVEGRVPLSKDKAQTVLDGKLVEIVDRVLLLHGGPIRKFHLSFNIDRCGDIDRWILFISRNGIKELTLYKLKSKFYKVPSCLYLCTEITYLSLYRCTIVLPASFKGFRSLTTLNLYSVYFPNNQLEILISICPLLEKLLLKYISGCNHLRISASKLDDLEVHVDFEDLCIENTPLLANLSMKLVTSKGQDVLGEAGCKLVHVLGTPTGIKRLKLYGDTLEVLSQGDVPIKLLSEFSLNYLHIDLNFQDMRQILATLCIFRSSPNLKELHIKNYSDKSTADLSPEDFWEPLEDFNCLFSQLKFVLVSNFIGSTSEMKLVEFVLANAPVLEKVQVELKEKINPVNILTEMIRFRRASSKAEIAFRALPAL